MLTSDRRQSQLASQGPVVLAEKLTQSLRNTGDLDLIEIDMQMYVLHIKAKTLSQDLTCTGNHHLRHKTTKSCFRRREDRSSSNPSWFSCVHLLTNGVLAPSHCPIVANARRDALRAEPHTLLGIC